MTEYFIVCMKWGKAFGPDYVNVLYNACKTATKRPTRFICLTDNAAGLLAGVEALSIPDIGLKPNDWYRPGVWPKVALFDRAFHGLRGRALFVDLDMVIVQDLDAFFDQPGAVIGTNANPNWGKAAKPAEGPEFGSMIFAFDLGGQPHVAENFQTDQEGWMQRFRQEQQYLHHALPQAAFWPDGWVSSFKRTLRQPIGLDLVLPPRQPGGSTKVVAFHGHPRPMDLIKGNPYFWDRFPHLGHSRVRWMADYWTINGGALPN